MSRLLKKSAQVSLDNNVKQLLINEYSKFYREEFEKSSLMDKIPAEHRERFLNQYLEDVVYSHAYLEDYDFLFEKVENALSEAANLSVNNAGDVFVEQFLEEEVTEEE